MKWKPSKMFKHLGSRAAKTRSFKALRPHLETLEPRQMLDAMPILTEILADNDGSHLDGNNEATDWIELYNAGDQVADLTGWHLTDDENEPTKWTFPATSLAVGEYLVVYASGNGSPDFGGNLHTNFRLSSNGEYLALLSPGGATVASEFSPSFPEQIEGVSYGTEQTIVETILIGPEASAVAFVPIGPLASDWTGGAEPYDETGWIAGTTGVGFDDGPSGTEEPPPSEIPATAKIGTLRLPTPTIIDHSTEFSGSFVAENIIDEDPNTHYASASLGANTYMVFDFGSEVTITGFLHHNRGSHPLDQILSSDLTFSTDSVFDGSDTVVSLTHTSQINPVAYSFAAQTARYVRWDVTGVDPGGTAGNQGGKEISFLGTSGPMAQIADPTIIAAATNHNSGCCDVANIFDNNTATDYASNGLGANTFIDLDFGSPTAISGFEFLDRLGPLDEIFFSKLIFSDTANFTNVLGEVTLHHEGQTAQRFYTFTEHTARYVRWEVLQTVNNINTNAGGKEIGFYTAIPSYLSLTNSPTITAGATAFNNTAGDYTSGQFSANNLFDDNLSTEYAAFQLGTVSAPLANDGTYLEFDFGETKTLAAFEHLDRIPFIDQSVVSTLYFSNDPTFDLSDPTVTIQHQGTSTFQTFPAKSARYVRWEVNEMTPGNFGNLGGKEMRFYEDPVPPSYDEFIGIDLQAELLNTNGSAYIRIPFDVADPLLFDQLELKMQYDDGFIAYLNGTEVAQRNAPVSAAWNSTATDNRDRRTALVSEKINLTSFLGSLNVGTNILAIHGLNSSIDDPEMLILPELIATDIGDVGSGPLQYFPTPSPGEPNGSGLSGIAQTPLFSLPSGTYSGPISVELTSGSLTAVIRYTTDGSKPTDSSTEYTSPISLTGSSTIVARAFEAELVDSPTSTETFMVLGSDVLTFNSNLPIVVLDTLGSSVGQNSFTEVFSSFIDIGVGGRAEITGPVDFAGRGGLRIRGSSSAGFPKKQYAFETWDENDADLAVSIFGMPAESDWILYAPYSDKSLLRNYLSYNWDAEISSDWSPRTKLVEVYFNDGGGAVSNADYAGVYVFMEKIKRDNDRVDIAKLDPTDIAEPDVTGGYILKVDRLDPGDSGFSTNGGLTLGYVEPKESEIVPEQATYIQNYLNEMEAVLYGPDFADPVLGYAAYIDVDSFINHHILVELTRNIDEFRLSTFYTKDRDGKLKAGPAWDYNLALGNVSYWDGQFTEGWYHDFSEMVNPGGLGYPSYEWYRRMFQDPEFELKYWDRWFELREDRFSTATLMAEIDQQAALLDEAQQRNFQKWPILGTHVWPNNFVGNTYQEEIDYLKNWLTARLTWIDTQFDGPPIFSNNGGETDPGLELTMTSLGSDIYYTTDGSDPRLPGTGSSETLVDTNAAKRVLIPDINSQLGLTWTEVADPVNYETWLSGSGGVGYDEQTTYDSLIDFDVINEMNDVNTSAYIRVPFTVDVNQLASFDKLSLRMNYDDGFIAYINGVKVEEANPPALAPDWNSSAGGDHADSQALQVVTFDISAHLGLLTPGNNILAIHALNNGIGSSDMLIVPELRASSSTNAGMSPSAQLYVTSITIIESTVVKARHLNSGDWSSMNEALFTVAVPLRITEVMYNPDGSDNSEFVEIVNTSSVAIPIAGVRLVGEEVDFTFDITEPVLGVDQRIVVVRNTSAFEGVYGTPPEFRVATGQWDGDGFTALDNGRDTLQLFDAAGGLIQEFTYDDDWYEETDGNGFSLVPESTSGDYNNPANWRSSAMLNGSPGFEDPDALDADFNGDGNVNATDLAILLADYGKASGAHRGEGDANNDHLVGLQDLLILKKTFGDTISSPAAAAAALTISIDTASNSINTNNSRISSKRNTSMVDSAILNLNTPTDSENRSEGLNNDIPLQQAKSERSRIAVDQVLANNLTSTSSRSRFSSRLRTHRGHKVESILHEGETL